MMNNYISAFHLKSNITSLVENTAASIYSKAQINNESDFFFMLSSSLTIYLAYLITTL